MNDDNTGWVKSWVKSINERNSEGLSQREIEKATIIGNATFSGNVGVGHAAEAGIRAVKELR